MTTLRWERPALVFAGMAALFACGDRERPSPEPTGIPLFALPQQDGTASGEQIAGSVKGTGAIAELSPRVRKLPNGRRGGAVR